MYEMDRRKSVLLTQYCSHRVKDEGNIREVCHNETGSPSSCS